MKIEDFQTETYVRRPFQVQAFEITQDNIAELAPHVGELCDDDGTPFIKSDKKKVGNNFKVWPGFFATVLKGHVRCYSRKTFFEQFGELNDRTSPVVEFLHGRCTVEEMISVLAPEETPSEPVDQDEPAEVVSEAPEEPVEAPVAEDGPTCEHGTPLDQECAYRKCTGGVESEDDEGDNEVAESEVPDEPAETPSAIEQYRAGLESVIKS